MNLMAVRNWGLDLTAFFGMRILLKFANVFEHFDKHFENKLANLS